MEQCFTRLFFMLLSLGHYRAVHSKKKREQTRSIRFDLFRIKLNLPNEIPVFASFSTIDLHLLQITAKINIKKLYRFFLF